MIGKGLYVAGMKWAIKDAICVGFTAVKTTTCNEFNNRINREPELKDFNLTKSSDALKNC